MAALRFKLRSISLCKFDRHFSNSILNPDSKAPLKSFKKSRAALNLLRGEYSPERIVEICRAAELTPVSHLDRFVFNKAISKLKNLNYFNGIREFLEESKALPGMKSERSMSYIILLYGQAGLLPDAVKTFEEMFDLGKTFEEMFDLGVEISAKTLNALLLACRLVKDYKEMEKVFMEFPNIYGIVPNTESYNTMIKGLCESGKYSSAYSILAEMEGKGIKPNEATFTPLIASCYLDQKFDDVGKVLEMMKERGITQRINTYNSRILSLCKLAMSKEAKALFLEFMSTGIKPNALTYTHLIYGFCREGDFEEAKSLFERMNKSGITPESSCYFKLIYYLCCAKDFDSALNICKQCMSKSGRVPNFTTMKALVQGLATISKVDEAKEIIGQLKEKFSGNSDLWSEIEQGLPTY